METIAALAKDYSSEVQTLCEKFAAWFLEVILNGPLNSIESVINAAWNVTDAVSLQKFLFAVKDAGFSVEMTDNQWNLVGEICSQWVIQS